MKLKKLLLLFVLVIVVVIIKSLFVEAFRIPTSSMENTLLAGDFIFVNKAAYKISSPENIPFTSIKLPSYNLVNHSHPERGDVVVFEFPGMLDELSPSPQVFYIKRVIGLPGDTVEIIKGKISVNGIEQEDPEGIPDTTVDMSKGEKDVRIYPPDMNWNGSFYGPLVIPKKGDIIQITPKNAPMWSMLINREHGRLVVSREGSVITIDGRPVIAYTFKKNYYFVMGDNRNESMDSRYWGFVPEDYIQGEALMVYWSIEPGMNNLDEIVKSLRWNRIFNIIK